MKASASRACRRARQYGGFTLVSFLVASTGSCQLVCHSRPTQVVAEVERLKTPEFFSFSAAELTCCASFS